MRAWCEIFKGRGNLAFSGKPLDTARSCPPIRSSFQHTVDVSRSDDAQVTFCVQSLNGEQLGVHTSRHTPNCSPLVFVDVGRSLRSGVALHWGVTGRRSFSHITVPLLCFLPVGGSHRAQLPFCCTLRVQLCRPQELVWQERLSLEASGGQYHQLPTQIGEPAPLTSTGVRAAAASSLGGGHLDLEDHWATKPRVISAHQGWRGALTPVHTKGAQREVPAWLHSYSRERRHKSERYH